MKPGPLEASLLPTVRTPVFPAHHRPAMASWAVPPPLRGPCHRDLPMSLPWEYPAQPRAPGSGWVPGRLRTWPSPALKAPGPLWSPLNLCHIAACITQVTYRGLFQSVKKPAASVGLFFCFQQNSTCAVKYSYVYYKRSTRPCKRNQSGKSVGNTRSSLKTRHV